MEQGDFICQFLDLCELELSQPVDCVEPARLEILLEMDARTSRAYSDQYKDNLCVGLLPYNLKFQVILIGLKIEYELVLFQMGKILAIDTAEEGECCLAWTSPLGTRWSGPCPWSSTTRPSPSSTR
jgi:hypothetical protein